MADDYVYTGEEGADEFRVLDTLVEDEDMTPKEAVQQILRLTSAPKTYNRQLGDHCYFTARGVLGTASRTAPDQQSRLVEFVHELRSKTVNDPKTGQPLEHDGQVIWSGLPTFGYSFADELHSMPAPNHTPQQAERWENSMAFFAQLDASTQEPKLDFTHTWALTYIICALDNEPTANHELRVRLACLWYIYDAEKIWSKVPDTKDFTLTNWQRWKQRLEELQTRFPDLGTQSIIDEALSEIKRVEKS
ncbi:hypothetical protein FB567DRAFT_518819 [Paraphoma chrysanthemicola]|uniref:Uncharacterized protein n=1 Tax=Paraphoma chrysanthemicola TaxID=798071 RepID=A0A8K0RER8_9PLEO|nr:hypothetical protein FB567DRAFT_518819 [Paraphoma chrysanthemicola]